MDKKTGLLLYNENKDILLINEWELPIDIQEDTDVLISALISFKKLTGIELDINNFDFINLGSHNNISVFALEFLEDINFQIKYNWFDLETVKKNVSTDNLEFVNRIEKYFLEDDDQEVDDFEVSNSINPLEPINFDAMNVQEKRNFYQKYLKSIDLSEEDKFEKDLKSGAFDSEEEKFNKDLKSGII